MIPKAIDVIIAHLITNNYLNEERFAKNFARGKFNIKKWGKRKIVQELKTRDISKYNIENALKEIEDGDYMRTLHTLATKRLFQLSDKSVLEKKRKLADYLLYRGWEPNLIYEKINELMP